MTIPVSTFHLINSKILVMVMIILHLNCRWGKCNVYFGSKLYLLLREKCLNRFCRRASTVSPKETILGVYYLLAWYTIERMCVPNAVKWVSVSVWVNVCCGCGAGAVSGLSNYRKQDADWPLAKTQTEKQEHYTQTG